MVDGTATLAERAVLMHRSCARLKTAVVGALLRRKANHTGGAAQLPAHLPAVRVSCVPAAAGAPGAAFGPSAAAWSASLYYLTTSLLLAESDYYAGHNLLQYPSLSRTVHELMQARLSTGAGRRHADDQLPAIFSIGDGSHASVWAPAFLRERLGGHGGSVKKGKGAASKAAASKGAAKGASREGAPKAAKLSAN
jgi:hypothetical protein